MTAPVLITLNHAGHGTVLVDGKDISNGIRGLSFTSEAGKVSELTLDVVPHITTIKGEARVILTAPSEAALIALGWTPPSGHAICTKNEACTMEAGHSFQCRDADRTPIPGPSTWNSREGRNICNTRTPCDHCLTTSEEPTNA